jgi:hypothetical protein
MTGKYNPTNYKDFKKKVSIYGHEPKLMYGEAISDPNYRTSYFGKDGQMYQCSVYKAWFEMVYSCYNPRKINTNTVSAYLLTFSHFAACPAGTVQLVDGIYECLDCHGG